ncbi:hypothetical protein Bca52824_089658 [Brassica carinata]|uniref:Fatty acyl-CoA reductase n=2 Tax=Brassica TaxID=3705 RepID=A0A8X7PF05_BRACI|nr:hypothetical protein Bca52824_089658 [Brassica carinata]
MSTETEIVSVLQYLDNKSILVIGAAGFLANIFVEKILRVAPNVKKLYLLLRASTEKSATQRFKDEILGKDLYRVLKEKYGPNLNQLTSEKVTVVSGDISLEDLGLQDTDLEHEMIHQVDAIVNLAATTKFDERYDIALGINTLGVLNVLNFAKRCAKINIFVQVSTAYVCGEKSGLIMETPYRMGETLNGTTGLDINHEKKLVEEKLDQLRVTEASPETITQTMKDMGLTRARTYGWPNTYVFTKAMGEMIVGAKRGNLPLVLIRPSIITSTIKEPFPGWTEGIRTIDTLGVGYGKGRLTCFLGDLNAVSDVMPADMVVNSMLVSMAVQAGKQKETIYHVGSSLRNPLKNEKLPEIAYHYRGVQLFLQNRETKAERSGLMRSLTNDAIFRTNLIAFISRSPLNQNSISTLPLPPHSQIPNLLLHNQNPRSSFFPFRFPATPRFHQHGARTGWNRRIRPEYGFDDEEDEDDHEEEEEEDRSLDLLLRFVENVFRKVSKRARRAVRSILPVSISTKLVGFSVNGVLILAFLWILKAFLEVACTLGTIVFTSILLIRGLWAGVAYVQESRNNRINELADDPRAWNGLWKEQTVAGKPAGFFVSTGTQGGGQETTAWTAITQLVHHGMLIVPIGYTFGAGMFKMDSIHGGSPYGAGVFAGDGSIEATETELALAEPQ